MISPLVTTTAVATEIVPITALPPSSPFAGIMSGTMLTSREDNSEINKQMENMVVIKAEDFVS